MTIKKAYDELENEGYILTRQGKGSIVAPTNLEFIKEPKQKEIEIYMTKILEIANQYNISNREVLDLLKFMMESDK